MTDYDQATVERFWRNVDQTDDCWEWTASKGQGYGRFYANGKQVPAHRFSYEMEVGEIPDGLQIDHLCVNRACVRPDHLEPVTPRENMRRAFNLPASATPDEIIALLESEPQLASSRRMLRTALDLSAGQLGSLLSKDDVKRAWLKARASIRERDHPTEQRCWFCKQWKDLERFPRDRRSHNGRASRCLECNRLLVKAYRLREQQGQARG